MSSSAFSNEKTALDGLWNGWPATVVTFSTVGSTQMRIFRALSSFSHAAKLLKKMTGDGRVSAAFHDTRGDECCKRKGQEAR